MSILDVLLIGLLAILMFVVIGAVTNQMTRENLQVHGSIDDYHLFDDHMDIYIDGKWYGVNYPSGGFTDLTDNSTLSLTLHKNGWFMFIPPGEYYDIWTVLKMPKEGVRST